MSGLCEHCVQGYVLEGTPAGSMEGSAYFHAASSTPSKRAVVLLTDIFGLALVNPKLMADRYSERLDCDVWVPDIFNGHPPVSDSELGPLLHDVPGTPTTLSSIFGFLWVIIRHIPGIFSNRPGVVDPRVVSFVKRIREEKKYEKIGVIGFCFGGGQVVRLASANIFDSAIVAHPAPVTDAQIQAINIPTSWICSEEDRTFGPKRRLAAEAIFKRKNESGKLDYEFQDYKGTVHGFAARPNLGIPVVKEAFEGSFEQTITWFAKTLV